MFLKNKKILITGLISDRSIAYGVAKACFEQGASLAFTCQNERFIDRVKDLAKNFNSDIVLICDVTKDEDLNNLSVELKKSWDSVDCVLHSIAFADKQAISGDFIENVTREMYNQANDISAYSFLALARALKPMLNKGGSLVALSYLGSDRIVPNYNMMGVSKAALESTARYMAGSLGKDDIRVNIVSAGPIRTLAASGIKGFTKILNVVEEQSPLKRNVTTEEVGNVCAFLMSNLASGVTGEVVFVDSGFNKVSAYINE